MADQPREIAGHVIRLLRDADRRTDMARRARAAAEANYRWEAQLARLDQVTDKQSCSRPGIS
jgi:hypothetical protein